eukprot:8816480-Prorocentrum_lima.AAC.1
MAVGTPPTTVERSLTMSPVKSTCVLDMKNNRIMQDLYLARLHGVPLLGLYEDALAVQNGQVTKAR